MHILNHGVITPFLVHFLMESLPLNPWLYLNTPSPGDRSPSRVAALEGNVTKTAMLVLACKGGWAHVQSNTERDKRACVEGSHIGG